MRSAVLAFGLFVLAAPSPASAQATIDPGQRPSFGMALAPGDPVPPVRDRDLLGRSVEYPYDAHKLTIVNFWATWCEPCRTEMPALQRLADERKKDGLLVVGLLLDQATSVEAAEFAEALEIRYPLLRASLETERAWGGIRLLPLTFLVSAEGRLLRKYVGSDPKLVDAIASDVAAALEGRPLGPPYVPDLPDATTFP